MYFEIHKTPKYSQPYWWVIRSSGNHEVLAASEMLASKYECIQAIRLITMYASGAMYYDRTGE